MGVGADPIWSCVVSRTLGRPRIGIAKNRERLRDFLGTGNHPKTRCMGVMAMASLSKADRMRLTQTTASNRCRYESVRYEQNGAMSIGLAPGPNLCLCITQMGREIPCNAASVVRVSLLRDNKASEALTCGHANAITEVAAASRPPGSGMQPSKTKRNALKAAHSSHN